MLCVVWVGHTCLICHRMKTELHLAKRRSIACVMFIFDVVSARANSPDLLSVLNLFAPRYPTRGSEFLRIDFHQTNYGIHEPMSSAMMVNTLLVQSIFFFTKQMADPRNTVRNFAINL
jgi:hypothetical protein